MIKLSVLTYIFSNFITSSIRVSNARQVDQHGSTAANTAARNADRNVLHDRPEITAISNVAGLDVLTNCFPELTSLVSRHNYATTLTNMKTKQKGKLECGPMPNLMVALPNIGGALCSTPQSLADAHY